MRADRIRTPAQEQAREQLRRLGAHLSPSGTVKARIAAIARLLGISVTRVRDLHYDRVGMELDEWITLQTRSTELRLNVVKDQPREQVRWLIWDEFGGLHQTSGQLEPFLGRMMALPSDVGDVVTYATRGGGWVIGRGARGHAFELHFDPQHLNATAAQVAVGWMEENAATYTQVVVHERRQTHSRPVAVPLMSASRRLREAAATVQLRDAAARRGWLVERLPLGLDDQPEAKAVVEISTSSSSPLSSLERAGLAASVARFEIVGSEVWALYTRFTSRFLPGPVTAVPVSSYSDSAFGHVTAERIFEASQRGPMRCRLRGTALGRAVDYESLAVPVASGGRRLVLTVARHNTPIPDAT